MLITNRSWLVKLSIVTLFTSSLTGLVVHADEQIKEITLEKIMSDPKWIGNSPQRASWLSDSKTITFKQNSNTSIQDLYSLELESLDKTIVPLEQLHLFEESSQVVNDELGIAAYIFNGDVYIRDLKSSNVKQITFTSDLETKPQFLTNNDLVYWKGSKAFALNLKTRHVKELASLSMSDQPKPPADPADLIAKEQHDLIEYVALKHKQKNERYQFKQNLAQQNQSVFNNHFYLGSGQYLVAAQLSPNGKHIFAVTAKSMPWRSDNDLMPNYIGQDGRIQFDKVRRRVSDSKPNQQNYWLLDLTTNEMAKISIEDLPDFDKDVLKDVKKENAQAIGETYKSENKKRTINLIVDWTWSQSPIQWNGSGDQVAIMMEAWDNKDRWIATIDFQDKKFVTQHQLHDDAWINYTFNDFGWFNKSDKLYWLSEESGYSHIYTKNLTSKKVHQLTSGKYEVSSLYLKKDDSSFIFRANVKHPGDYQIYTVSPKSKKVKKPNAITTKKGNNSYLISPDETKLLVTHSTNVKPEELYLVDLEKKGSFKQLTDTTTKEFNSMPWQEPLVVEVPSSHSDAPIYAKVYLPENYKEGAPKKAVIFNHGAGYLQNSDFGWSGYFREFMFHNMLAQQGYVVMDMDYRASKGYGRDWRTAIYRQMGTPEIQDLEDGVEWLVANVNVDRNRIGTYGGSYGGFMTFMALFNKPELFQAGAALRPVSDWAHYNDGYTSNILNRPEDDMLAYRKSSPIYFAEGLQKPLLINAPMIDDNVFFLDVVRLVQRLIELEKENFETAIYPVEPHGFVQPSSWLDEYRRIYKLFETHL